MKLPRCQAVFTTHSEVGLRHLLMPWVSLAIRSGASLENNVRLDTLWIMDMKPEFEEALSALDQIDFTSCSLELLNVFETTIRYLGGFIAAYDLTEGEYP